METKRTRLSLAQFSRNLVPGEAHSVPVVELESDGEKQFAANVVAAMSNPPHDVTEEITELPEVESAQSYLPAAAATKALD